MRFRTESGTVVHVLPGKQPGAFVIMSGTHGVEGYGSEIVQDAIKDAFNPELSPTVFLVRKVNAWAYDHKERFTEDGRDLNRAGDPNPPPNKYYPMVKKAVNKRHGSVEALEAALTLGAMRHPILFAKASIQAGGPVKGITEAIMSGQSQDDTGFEFRGTTVARELVQLGTLLHTHVPSRGPLIVWDLHTGVGEPGTGDILICDTDEERHLLTNALPPGGESAQRIRQGGKGVYRVYGSAMGAIYRMIKGSPPARPDIVVTQEFATRPEKEVLLALVNKHAGDKDVDLKPMFYLEDTEWKRQVHDRGLQLYNDFLAYLRRPRRPRDLKF